MPNEDHVGRAAMAKNLSEIIPDVYPMYTETAPDGR